MDRPFRMRGRTVEIYHYRVDSTEERPGEGGEMETVSIVQNYPTREEAQALVERNGGTITALDTSVYQWMDGLVMPDVPDTYAAAMKAYEMGEAEYQRREAFEEKKKADQLRADLDYVMLMGGL